MGSIYTGSRSNDFFITPPNGKITDNLDFVPQTVIVDNFTNQWVYLPTVPKFIPPGVSGATVPTNSTTTQLSALFQAPPGLSQPTLVITSSDGTITPAHLTFMEDAHPASPGVVGQGDAQKVIATLVSPANGSSPFETITVPAGTQSIGYLSYIEQFSPVHINPGVDTPIAITIQGHTTGQQYVSIFSTGAALNSSLANGGPQWVLLDPSDTALDCQISANVSTSAIVDILVSPLAMSLDVAQAFDESLSVGNSNFLPATWQAAQHNFNIGVGSIAAGASVTLIPANANAQILIHEINLHVVGVANSFFQIQDSNVPTTLRNMSGAINDAYVFNFHGAFSNENAFNTSTVLKNTSAVASGAINGGGGYSYQ